jgi:hypothetical protein
VAITPYFNRSVFLGEDSRSASHVRSDDSSTNVRGVIGDSGLPVPLNSGAPDTHLQHMGVHYCTVHRDW